MSKVHDHQSGAAAGAVRRFRSTREDGLIFSIFGARVEFSPISTGWDVDVPAVEIAEASASAAAPFTGSRR
ncbi:hypothetical protein EGT50_13760 [Rhodococcus xishaensis]|uniref:Uncharacterized protein n=1 Tax=Rhodococcus xishaensis TaxID=2487364 RepID=A0A3S3A7C6_9NOCA|nr:hypothetical protein EGT50_13760 [Rhodococcus xishaensis]